MNRNRNIPTAATEEEDDDGPCFYKVLNVPRTASMAQIKQAYYRKALEHHPDRNAGKEEAAAQAFVQVGAAYEVLADPETRHIYDEYGRAGLVLREQGYAAPTRQQQQQQGQAHAGFPFEHDFGFRRAQEIFEAFWAELSEQQQSFVDANMDDDLFFATPFLASARHAYLPPSAFADSTSLMAHHAERRIDLFGLDSAFSGMLREQHQRQHQGSSAAMSGTSFFGTGEGVRRSVRTVTTVGQGGRRFSRKETTVTHSNGRQETVVEEWEEEAPLSWSQHQERGMGPWRWYRG